MNLLLNCFYINLLSNLWTLTIIILESYSFLVVVICWFHIITAFSCCIFVSEKFCHNNTEGSDLLQSVFQKANVYRRLYVPSVMFFAGLLSALLMTKVNNVSLFFPDFLKSAYQILN